MTRTDPGKTRSWRAHPWASRALRLAVFLVPIAASFGVALILSASLPRVADMGTLALWIGVVGAVSLVTLVLFERAAKRLLPLAALLNLSLVFPDHAPSRFAVARRSGRQHDLQRSLREARAAGHLDEAQRMGTVIELVLALSVHDRATRGHSERVRVFTDMLADEMNVSQAGRDRLRWAAMLHDIGKLEVPTTTLHKKGKPNAAEWVALHRHPEEGAHLVATLLPWLGEWGLAVEQHHERFDGSGYPHGLRGSEISMAARIVSLADTYEVMTAPRSYKKPMSVPEARRELVRVAGTQLDPAAVRAFLNISLGRLWRAVGVGAWLAQFPLAARLTASISRLGAPSVAGATATAVLVVGGFAGAAPGRAYATAIPSAGQPQAAADGGGVPSEDSEDGGGAGSGSMQLSRPALANGSGADGQVAGVASTAEASAASSGVSAAPPASGPTTGTPGLPSTATQVGEGLTPPPVVSGTGTQASSGSGNDGDEAQDGVCTGAHAAGAHQDCDDDTPGGESGDHRVTTPAGSKP